MYDLYIYVITLFIYVVPVMRLELICGGFGFLFNITSTLIFSVINIFSFNVNPIFKIITWICLGLYAIFTSIFFFVIERDQVKTFFWTDNWKNCSRNKVWNNNMHSSKSWNEVNS